MCGIYGEFFNTSTLTEKKLFLKENDKNILISDLPGFLETPDEFNINYQKIRTIIL